MKHEDKNVPLSKKVGDKLERAGQKISNSGANKVGSFISKIGDKLEHASDPKPDVNDSVNKSGKV